MSTDYTRPAPGHSPVVAPTSGPRPLTILLAAIVLGGLCLFIDEPIARFCRQFQDGGSLRLGGDLRRGLESLQQFGDVLTTLIAVVLISLLDPARRSRLLDLAGAWLSVAAVVQVLKILAGRPRPGVLFGRPQPGFDAVVQFTGPLRPYPLPRQRPDGVVYDLRHTWEVWRDIGSDLWSMPSSHTSAAAALAVCLGALYPAIRPLVWALVAIVAVSRVLLGAHFPSDVIVGAGIGYAIATVAMHGSWGRRALRRPIAA